MKEVVIVSAKRSAIGNFGGSLKNISAVELGSIVISNMLKDSQIDPSLIDEVIIGNVLSAGLGQNIARQIALNAGLKKDSTAYTVNQVCGSGLKAVILGAQSIMLGDNEIVIAGGVENMSQAAHVLTNHRFGQKFGNSTIIDTMMVDGLTDAFSKEAMGVTAENIAETFNISRNEQDQFAAISQKKAEEAIKTGKFKDEIVPISIPSKKGETVLFDTDEFPRFGTTEEKLTKLKPSFKKDGTVTAGNTSGINDGAAMVMLMSKDKAEELGLDMLGTIVSSATVGVEPEIMGIGPVPAMKKALDKANLSVSDLDLIEANEAFAAQSLYVARELHLDIDSVNVNGGAISLGHPIGASGARILVTLLHEMKKRDAKKGIATLCIGGGQGVSMVISR